MGAARTRIGPFLKQTPRAGELIEGDGYCSKLRLDFCLWVPPHISPELSVTETRYPLIIYLHGVGQARDKSGVRNLLDTSDTFRKNFIVLIPRCPSKRYWFHHHDSVAGYNNEVCLDALDGFEKLIEEVLEYCPVDHSRVTLCGSSMGGFGALKYLELSGLYVTAVVLLSAHFDSTIDERFYGKTKTFRFGLDTKTFDGIIRNCRLNDIRLWIIHSENDKVCSYKDMLFFYTYCLENDFRDVCLQIDESPGLPMTKHSGPYFWMFGEGRPCPLMAFAAFPDVLD